MARPLATIPSIRSCRLDAILDFTPWPRLTAFYCAVSKAKLRVGFRAPGQYRHWNYDLVADHSHTCHELENYRSLLRVLHMNPSRRCAGVSVPLPTARNSGAGPRIVFHPWASGDLASLREWPQERWVELARRLDLPGATVVITGGPRDVDRCMALRGNRLLARWNSASAETFCGPVRPAACGRPLFQSVESIVISVNTGIMHLAAIVGAPGIVEWPYGNPIATAPSVFALRPWNRKQAAGSCTRVRIPGKSTRYHASDQCGRSSRRCTASSAFRSAQPIGIRVSPAGKT